MCLSAQVAAAASWCSGYLSFSRDHDLEKIQYCLDVAKVDPSTIFTFHRMHDADLHYFDMAKQYGVRFPNERLPSSTLKCSKTAEIKRSVCMQLNRINQNKNDCFEESHKVQQQCLADRADAWIGLGVDFRAPSIFGKSPLEDAIDFRQVPIAKVLLRHGATTTQEWIDRAKIDAREIYDEMQIVSSITTTQQ